MTGLPAAGNDERGAGKTRMVPAVTDIKSPIHAAAEPAHNAARTDSLALPSRGLQELYRARQSDVDATSVRTAGVNA
jgi:hypothetical protein